MFLKALCVAAALALFLAYFLPVVFRLKDAPLTVVVIGGAVLAAVDAWYTLRKG
jgi:hypothetical protein